MGVLVERHGQGAGPATPSLVAHAPAISPDPTGQALAADDPARVDDCVSRASSAATLRAYRSDWQLFCSWCDERGYQALPASAAAVAAFVTLLAEHGYAPSIRQGTAGRRYASPYAPRPLGRSTISRRLAAIVFAHHAAGVTPPTQQSDAERLTKVMRAIRRDKRDDVIDKKRPADGDVLRDMLRTIAGNDLRAHRDRALLALGMAGAFRRSELVAITVSHVAETGRGLLVLVPSSKTDQGDREHRVAIPDGKRLGPVQHYRAWLEKAGIEDGPVFRKLTPQGRLTAKPMSAQGVALVVKAAANAAGYPPSAFSGHSLRAGFLTEAGRQNANLFKMREHSRHASIDMVAEYVHDLHRFREHAGESFL